MKVNIKIEEFYDEICNFSNSFENRDLEEYLLAVMKNVINEKDNELTYEIMLWIFKASFETIHRMTNKELIYSNTLQR